MVIDYLSSKFYITATSVDCVWQSWTTWESCDATCGGGVQRRQRDRDGPYFGGEDCLGSPEETEQCNEHPCPGEKTKPLHVYDNYI